MYTSSSSCRHPKLCDKEELMSRVSDIYNGDVEAWRPLRGSVDQWSQIQITLMMIRIRIRIKDIDQ